MEYEAMFWLGIKAGAIKAGMVVMVRMIRDLRHRPDAEETRR